MKTFDVEELSTKSFTAADDRNPKYLSYVQCLTTKGVIEMEIHHLWSPRGAERFLDLINRGYYDEIALFRKNRYIVQFGAVQHPQKGRRKQFSGLKNIPDEPKTDCFGKCRKGHLWDGALAFAGGGKDSRGDQVFWVHHKGSQPLGMELWETPIGNITKGFEVVKNELYGGYGEKVDQVKIFQEGLEYTKREFPLLDYMVRCEIIDDEALVQPRTKFDFDVEENQMVKRLKGGAKYITGAKDSEIPYLLMFMSIAMLILVVGRFLVKLKSRGGFDKAK